MQVSPHSDSSSLSAWESADGVSAHLSCPFCYEKAGTIEAMLEHLGASHLKTLAQSVKCPVCRRQSTDIVAHLLSHLEDRPSSSACGPQQLGCGSASACSAAMGGPDVKRGSGRMPPPADSAFAALDRSSVCDGDHDGCDPNHLSAGFRDEPEDGHWQRSKASACGWRGTEQGRTAAPGVTSIADSPDTACSSKAPPPGAWSTSRGGTTDRRAASDPTQILCESESPLLATGHPSVRSPSMLGSEVTPSPSAEAGVDQRPVPGDSTAEGSDEAMACGRADQRQHVELADSFSKSSRLKQPPAAELHASVGLSHEPTSGGSTSAASVSSATTAGAAGTHLAIVQQMAAAPTLVESALGSGKLQGTAAAHASESAEAELSHEVASSSSAGMPDAKQDAQRLLREQAGVQLAASLHDVEQHDATVEQQSKESKQPTAKQKIQLEDHRQPMAEDTSEMRSQFVKQLLISAFDMDRQW